MRKTFISSFIFTLSQLLNIQNPFVSSILMLSKTFSSFLSLGFCFGLSGFSGFGGGKLFFDSDDLFSTEILPNQKTPKSKIIPPIVLIIIIVFFFFFA